MFFGIAADGGAEAYADKLDTLSQKGVLTKSELQFMDRYEKLMEYMKPKKARVDGKGDAAEATVINIVNYKDDK